MNSREKVLKEMLDKTANNFNKKDKLYNIMDDFQFNEELEEDTFRNIMLEICSYINEVFLENYFKNPYNISLYITNMCRLNIDILGKSFYDNDDYYIEETINKLLEEKIYLFDARISEPSNEEGKKYLEEEGLSLSEIIDGLEKIVPDILEEGGIEWFLDVIINYMREYIANKHLKVVLSIIDEIYLIAIESNKKGFNKIDIMLSIIVMYSIIEVDSDSMLSLIDGEHSYAFDNVTFLNYLDFISTKENFELVKRWFDTFKNNEIINNYPDLLEFYIEDKFENNQYEAIKNFNKLDDIDFIHFLQKSRNEIICSVETYNNSLLEFLTQTTNSYSISLSYFVDLFILLYI